MSPLAGTPHLGVEHERSPFVPSAPRAPSVRAAVSYLAPPRERPVNYMYEPPPGEPWHNCEYLQTSVRIFDARALALRPSVHAEGFELWEGPSAVRDFLDPEEVVRTYYPEVAALACAVTGAQRGHVFDHLIRTREPGRPPLAFGRSGDGSKASASGRVHNDYSEASALRRLERVLGADAREVRAGRFGIVNVWRSLSGPVLDTPLALCDARTVSAADLVPAEVRYPERTGEIFLVQEAPRHRWSFFSEMDRDEALVFTQYDSQVGGVARFTPHAAFDLPHIPPGAPLRQSIEARCLVVYG